MKKKEQQLDIPRFIKLKEVKRLTSLSTSEVYRRISHGAFPKQVRIGPKSVAWVEREVYAWLDTMIAGREFDPDA